MKILIAPDSFKESLSALEAAQAIEEGVLSVWPEAQCILVPMADGGEGTVNAVAAALQGEMKEVQVTGPLGQPVLAQLALVPRRKLAVIEMAEASGLSLVPIEERDPMRASSYGTGELIMVALEAGCTEILLGLGGSATVDGGMGTLEALGVGLLGHDGEPVHSCGAALASVAFLDLTGLDPRLKACAFSYACDVTSPLLGPHGAVMVYGEQKGATRSQLEALESGMTTWASLLPKELATLPGAGAAGGLAAGLMGVIGGELLSGVEYIADLVGLDEAMQGVDLVITGEGAINHQTVHGKTPVGVAKRSRAPVVALAGSLGPGYERVYEHGIDVCWSIQSVPCTLEESLRDAKSNLTAATARVIRTLRIGEKL